MLAAASAFETDHMSAAARAPVYFQAPDFTHWTVHEVHDPLAETGRSLMFVSTSGFRRVRSFPDGWHRLSAQELWALSWQR